VASLSGGRLYLMKDRGFTPSGAGDLVSEYKRTIAFAGLTERGATVSPDVPDEQAVSEGRTGEVSPSTVVSSGTWYDYTPVNVGNVNRWTVTAGTATLLEIPVPLAGEGFARLSLPARMSERAWQQLLSVLNAYKPGIVTTEVRSEDSGSGTDSATVVRGED
jgi:hypothetical protein